MTGPGAPGLQAPFLRQRPPYFATPKIRNKFALQLKPDKGPVVQTPVQTPWRGDKKSGWRTEGVEETHG